MQRLYIALDRLLRVERRAVAAAFHEGDARHHWITMQSIDRVDHRLAHQPMDQEPMLVRVDLGFTATSNYKMQAIRRDRAVEKMVWRARPASAGLELGVAERAHHLLLEFRRLAIRGDGHPGREAPRTICQRFSAGNLATRASRNHTGKHDASLK